jgi:hypothetical protein
MAEMLNVKVHPTGELMTVPDVEPTGSAEKFWQLSDDIWKTQGAINAINSRDVPVQIPMLEARDTINEVMGTISKDLVIAGAGRTMRFPGLHPGYDWVIEPEMLDMPHEIRIGTQKLDDRCRDRYIVLDGKTVWVEFTDDHRDKYRKLYANMFFHYGISHPVLKYTMEREQMDQDGPTSIGAILIHGGTHEMGHEGDGFADAPLTEEQEVRVINLFRTLGGIPLHLE